MFLSKSRCHYHCFYIEGPELEGGKQSFFFYSHRLLQILLPSVHIIFPSERLLKLKKHYCQIINLFAPEFHPIWHEDLFLKLINNKEAKFFIALFQTCIINQNVQ